MNKAIILIAILSSIAPVMKSSADVFGSGANQFSIDFSTIGNAGNAAYFHDYGPEPFFPDTYDAPYAGYGSVNYTYRIGTHEVTIDQFTKANAASGGQIGNDNEHLWNSGWPNPNNHPLDLGVHAPATAVNVYEAARFVNWLTTGDANTGVYSFSGNTISGIDRSFRNGNDLAYVIPNDDEWFKAAYYKPVNDGTYSTFSSGLNTSPSIGTNGWNLYPGPDTHGFNPVWETGTGAQEQNGTYDMMGNIWEWTETETVNDQYVIRGGSAYADETYASIDGFRPSLTSREQDNIGFRVVAIPEPNTIILLVLSGYGLLISRRYFNT